LVQSDAAATGVDGHGVNALAGESVEVQTPIPAAGAPHPPVSRSAISGSHVVVASALLLKKRLTVSFFRLPRAVAAPVAGIERVLGDAN
jgi:hypothetical protein